MKRILNIGCDKTTYGTDFVDLYPKRPEVKKCNIDTDRLPYPDETFDEVYSTFVFEHLTNPEHYFAESLRVLRGGG